MSPLLILAGALILDAAFGEPKWLWSRVPHPAVVMGRAIGWCDARFNTGDSRRLTGAIVMAGLVALAAILGTTIAGLPDADLIEIAVVAILLAQGSLAEHVGDVARGLRTSLDDGRAMVARIVSRDTAAMDAPAVARAAIESAAENLSDGVVAPALWYLVLGLPGLLIYKVTNTADSMIGYRTPRHEDFGWAAARLDDVLNWVPARLTALMMAALSGQLGQWRGIAADARLHRSPNAGWPEAAMSRALGVSLGGPRSYDGTMRAFPFVHPQGRKDPGAAEIEAAVGQLWRVWGAGLMIVLALTLPA